MAKVLVILLSVTISLISQDVHSWPQSHYYRVYELNNENNALSDEPVRYHGAQLWNIPFNSEFARNTILGLQDNFGKCILMMVF